MGQEQHLGNDHVGDVIVNRSTQEDDAVLQQPRVDVERPLPSVRALDNGGDEILDGWDTHEYADSIPGKIVNGPQGVAADIRGDESSRPPETRRLAVLPSCRLKQHAQPKGESLSSRPSAHVVPFLCQRRGHTLWLEGSHPICEVFCLSATGGLLSLASEKREGTPQKSYASTPGMSRAAADLS